MTSSLSKRSACKPVREILVDYFFESESEKGDTILTAFALDGRIIQLVKPSGKRLEQYSKSESDESKQLDYQEWLRLRGNRTVKGKA